MFQAQTNQNTNDRQHANEAGSTSSHINSLRVSCMSQRTSWDPVLQFGSTFTFRQLPLCSASGNDLRGGQNLWFLPRVVAFFRVWRFLENVRQFIPCLWFFFFFEVEIRSHTLILLFRPGSVHSGSASRNKCGWEFPDECVWAHFLVGLHTMPAQWLS